MATGPAAAADSTAAELGTDAFLAQLYKELESPFVWSLLPSSYRSESSRWDSHIRRLADVLLMADSPWTRVVLHLNLSWLFFKVRDTL